MLRISLLLALLFLGVALVAAQEEEDVEGERTIVPLIAPPREWIDGPARDRRSRRMGIVQIILEQIYFDPNDRDLTVPFGGRRPKPSRSQYAIIVNPGCDGGVRIVNWWASSRKRNNRIENSFAEEIYLTQEGNDWYSNFPGFIYEYDPDNCPERSFTIEVVVGGSQVASIQRAPRIRRRNQ